MVVIIRRPRRNGSKSEIKSTEKSTNKKESSNPQIGLAGCQWCPEIEFICPPKKALGHCLHARPSLAANP